MRYTLIALLLLNALSAGIVQTERAGIDAQLIGLWESVRLVGICQQDHEVAFAFSDIEPEDSSKVIKFRWQLQVRFSRDGVMTLIKSGSRSQSYKYTTAVISKTKVVKMFGPKGEGPLLMPYDIRDGQLYLALPERDDLEEKDLRPIPLTTEGLLSQEPSYVYGLTVYRRVPEQK